jgi:hypothetical protein
MPLLICCSLTFQFSLFCIIILSKALVTGKGNYHVRATNIQVIRMAGGGQCREVHQKGRHNSWRGAWKVLICGTSFRSLCMAIVLIY